MPRCRRYESVYLDESPSTKDLPETVASAKAASTRGAFSAAASGKVVSTAVASRAVASRHVDRFNRGALGGIRVAVSRVDG